MSCMVGSARSSYNSPKAGDQSGKEVSQQLFYKHSPYWLGFTLKDTSLLPKLAQSMVDACNNNAIGYSQPYREEGRRAYVKVGSISKMDLCTVDCSSLVNLCLYSIGINLPNFNTASEPQVLRNSGLFTEKKVYSENDCVLGMILVTPSKGHTLIVTQSDNVSRETLKSIDEIVKEVIQGKWGNGNARKSKLTKAGYDYELIRQKVNEALKK